MNNTVAIILDLIRPSELEPSVTYTIPNGAGGNVYVKMPRLFVDLGNDFERWFREENKDLLDRFYKEFRIILKKGGREYDIVVNDFTDAWSHEEYYKFLIGCWQIHEENYQKESEEANESKYWDGIDWGKVDWCQKKLEETRILIFKAKAALYFIHKTKSIIKPHIGIPGTGQRQPITSVDEKGKRGSKKDPYNAKIKAKFLEMVIDAKRVENKTFRNNDEKFAHYAKVLQDDYGLVVSAGTLENNWSKSLDNNEGKQLRELFIAQNLKHLAVKIVTEQ